MNGDVQRRRFHTYSLLSCMTSCLFIRVQCTRRGPRLGLQMCPRFAFIWGVRRWPARAAQVVFQRRLIVFYVLKVQCGECGRVVRLASLCVRVLRHKKAPTRPEASL